MSLTPNEWTWTGASTEWATPRLGGAAGVLVVGEVVRIREALAGTAAVNDVKTVGPHYEVKHGCH